MKKEIIVPNKGLVTDPSIEEQPKGTYRFALNTVNESDEGDVSKRSNEQGNKACYQLPEDYIPLGEVSIGNGETLIFSTSLDETASEIGIADGNCNYTTVANADLGFKVTKQIDATYRLRRGCERVVYFVTPTPMIVNIDKIDEYRNENGEFEKEKFSLFKTYDQLPILSDIVVEQNGSLPPGSYNFSVQYLDNDLNPTEWIISTDTIKIYNDTEAKSFSEIRGSTAKETDYQNFGNTSKSIKLLFSDLDTDYPYYRVAAIAANSGSGQINSVRYSREISTQVKVFNYAGEESMVTDGTVEEVQAFNNIISEANHIEQVDNMLLLGETKGKQVDFCKLQKYASRIKSDMIYKKVPLNTLTKGNSKTPTVDFEGAGYMPGEIYSFGLVYLFADGTTTPEYHIPGKNPNVGANTSFTIGENVRSMSNDNQCENTFYTPRSSCADFWGLDSEGDGLVNEPVRHHRFPLRSEVGFNLYEVESLSDEGTQQERLILNISGEIDPTLLEDSEGNPVVVNIPFIVDYEVGGNSKIYEGTINSSTYDPLNGLQITLSGEIDNIVVNNIYEDNSALGDPSNGGVTSGYSNLTYETEIGTIDYQIEDLLYTTNVMGIRFSGIELPDMEDTNGNEIVGYYIVRTERDEANKTIVDSGILSPLLDEYEDNGYFVAHGHMAPNFEESENKIRRDMFALIHPEHRFSNSEYRNVSKVIQEGVFEVSKQITSSVRTQDVMAGTSYDPEVAKRRESDGDGFSLHTFTRDNVVNFKRSTKEFADEDDIKEIFYLDSLSSKPVTDYNDERKEVFNVSGDNKIGILQLNKQIELDEINKKFPYVVLKRDISDPYGTFEVLQYHNELKNRVPFLRDQQGNIISGTSVDVYNGDSYVTPMRYHSAVYYDTRTRKRATKSGILNTIIGALATIAGAVLIATGVGAAAGLMLIGFGVSQIATGIKKEKIAKVYKELYEAGLRNCVDDKDTTTVFGPNPPDDEIQWLGDVLTNLWFESSANMSLRQGATEGITDFLNAPAEPAQQGDWSVTDYNLGFGGTITSVNSSDSPVNILDSYLLEKLTVLDSESSNGRLYQGFPNAEIYEINKDYRRRNKEKPFYALGIEYDCCSDCQETFSHRVHYSEQSFQEELTDNFRVFLPNNYRDIEGNKGKITNIIRWRNNIYIQTEEGMWHLPQTYQERITGDVLSFLGTGEYFSIPPKLIVDTDKSSAGTRQKWAVKKTKNGIIFPSIDEGKIYQFDGQQLKPISDFGNSKWFQENLPLNINKQYNGINGRNYPYFNNPSNPFGAGIISTYDTKNERYIFTKRDFTLPSNIGDNGYYELCFNDGNMVIFEDFSNTVQQKEDQGWTYEGIENCRLKFSREVIEQREETRQQVVTVPNDTEIYVFYDNTGSFDATARQQIKDAVSDWEQNFAIQNPDWTGSLNEIDASNERWLQYPQEVLDNYAGAGKNVIVISFINEAAPQYHSQNYDNSASNPTSDYTNDYNQFVSNINQFESFIGIAYPIAFPGGNYSEQTKACVINTMSAVLAGISTSEANLITPNPALSQSEWDDGMDWLVNNNGFSALGPNLSNYGWTGKWDRSEDNGTVITAEQFNEDIQTLLEGSTAVEEVTATVSYPTTEFDYIDGSIVQSPIEYDKSWTMSFSLKDNTWIGWHSYLPNFYFYVANRFFSWVAGNDYLWEHNTKNVYHKFYGNNYPFIFEMIALDQPINTKTWEDVLLKTDAQKYIDQYKDFVEQRYITFNKLIAYNNYQTTGLQNLVVKDTESDGGNYLLEQVDNQNGNITIDRNERDWTLNELRDYRINYSEPIFRKDAVSLVNEYYIDKVLNENALDYDKNWWELQSLRDKYLALRLIFDNFEDVKLTVDYSVQTENKSHR